MTLPITLILPTRNAMGSIANHVRDLAEVLPRVAQIVVVDSSEDGTLDFLRGAIDLPTAEFHARPRGLYESWNFAARQATAEFVYFSTVGDTITLAGLEHLFAVARRHDAEITISPPEMFDDRGQPMPDRVWPIHELSAQMEADSDGLLGPAEAFILSTSYVPSTILGSSASNLYRRTFLHAHPFLENWGHCADSPWIMANCLFGKIAVTSRCIAKFVVHEKEPTSSGGSHAVGLSHYEDMYRRAQEGLFASRLPSLGQAALDGWLVAHRRRERQLLERIDAYGGYLARRDEKIAVLEARVKSARSRTAEYEVQLKESNQKVIDLRRQLWSYEQTHRKAFGVAGLYLAAKIAQARKLWQLFVAKGAS